MPKKGDIVHHKKYGPAIFEREVHGYWRVVIQGTTVPFHLPREEFVEYCPPSQSVPPQARTVLPDTALPPTGTAARRTIESLRFGITPPADIRDLTIGFDELNDWICARLPDGVVTLSEVSGQFGSGKSHVLGLARHIAESRGFATCHAELDAGAVTFAQPKKLLFTILSSLRLPGGDGRLPILSLMRQAIQRGADPPQVLVHNSGFIDRTRGNFNIVRYLHQHDLLDEFEEELEAALSGDDTVAASELGRRIQQRVDWRNCDRFYPPIGREVCNRPFDFLEALAGVAHLARNAGHAGLVVLLDECEVEDAMLRRSDTERACALVRGLGALGTGSVGHMLTSPMGFFFANVRGDGTLARTLESALDLQGSNTRFELKPFSQQEKENLRTELWQRYRVAYGIRDGVIHNATNLLHDGPPRSDIRSFVAACDLNHGPRRG